MTRDMLKRLLGALPRRQQQALKRLYYEHKLRRGQFSADEPEFARLDSWLNEGDWVLDIGANIGHYTCRLAELVGPQGHVIALEPVAETFHLLSTNVAYLPAANVTLLNVAASDHTDLVGMTIPRLATGLRNFYMAHLSQEDWDVRALCLPIDALGIQSAVRLVKIDVEGHELSVLKGMKELLGRCRPMLIVEGDVPEVAAFLNEMGYWSERYPASPNRVFYWGDSA